MPAFGISGLSSGINSGEIISAMVKADRNATVVLENRKTLLEARLQAVRTFNTRLLTAQVDVSALKRPATFTQTTATSAAPEAVGASLTAGANVAAVAGTYSFEVVSLAKAHQVATAGVASDSAFRGTGTISLQVGPGAPVSVPIGSGEASLQGIAKAINDTKAGVTASVVNDGSENPFRLVLQSSSPGSAGAITVSASDGDAGDGQDLSALFAGMTTLAAADDASLRLGSGPGAIVVSKSSNTVTDLIPGVTLDLKRVTAGPVTVSVARDVQPAVTAVQTAVTSLNAAITYLADNTGYDPKTGKGGILIGESSLRSGLNRVTAAMLAGDNALAGSFGALSSLGITIDRGKGTFSVDEKALRAKLAEDPVAVAKLFTSSGASSDPTIEFATLDGKTVARPYAVAVTTAAAQARVAAAGAISADGGGNIAIDSTNKELALTINGTAVTATLAEGTWTRAQLATQLEKSINAVSGGGAKVSVGLSGNELDLRSVNFGSGQTIKVTGGSANAVLNLSTGTATGVDVQGTIDGLAAGGVGKVLTGIAGKPSEGLKLIVNATAPTTATMTVRKGLAQLVGEGISRLTDVDTGSLTRNEDGLEATIETLGKRIKGNDERLDARRARYEAKFLTMERTIASFKSQESRLAAQITAFQNAASARGK